MCEQTDDAPQSAASRHAYTWSEVWHHIAEDVYHLADADMWGMSINGLPCGTVTRVEIGPHCLCVHFTCGSEPHLLEVRNSASDANRLELLLDDTPDDTLRFSFTRKFAGLFTPMVNGFVFHDVPLDGSTRQLSFRCPR
jgi:hypothetical protein